MGVKEWALRLCDDCIDGIGEMCHEPACALCRHRVDLPIMRELLTDHHAAVAQARRSAFRDTLEMVNRWIEDPGLTDKARVEMVQKILEHDAADCEES